MQHRSLRPLIGLTIIIALIATLAGLALALSPPTPIQAAAAPAAVRAHSTRGANLWRPEAKLTTWAQKTCIQRETYLYGVVIWACQDGTAACWWRDAPYHNTKCWVVYHQHYHSPIPDGRGISKPVLSCVAPAWANLAGRVTKRGSWECERLPLLAATDHP